MWRIFLYKQNQVKYKWRDRGVLFATLLLFWLMLNNSLALDSLLIGIVVSLIITILFCSGLSFFTEFRFTPKAFVAGILYYIYFFKELIKANFRLAIIVLSPSLPINPGIVKVRTQLKSRMGRLMLANSITLTPGTLTMELEGEWIYVHCVNVTSTDTEEATAQIVSGFESYLEVMYG
ncbi:MAG: Na+/H+ antiporter subunit E [Gammaproteobacteria bacterium]|nr:Na+/H+ antiporter subunit E [Gammaproteobacteria bacterium]